MGVREGVGRIGRMAQAGIDVAVDGNRLRSRRWPTTAVPYDRTIRPSVLSRERADLVRRLVPDDADAIVAASARIVSGEFRLLGYEPTTLSRPLRYDCDPFSGGTWPSQHGLRLDYRTAKHGDPKWIWELNRLQHVPLLLAAWLVGGDERSLTTAVGDLDAWLAQARSGFGIAWSNGFEAGLRATSLALCFDALRQVEQASDDVRGRVAAALAEHVRWIVRYPSLHSSANNHRLGELAGVIATAALVPELGLDRTSSTALSELERRCREQFEADGGHVEQAFGYAVFATDLLLSVAGCLDAVGRDVPGWLDETMRRAADALALQLGADDPEPRYGDCDDGRAALLDGRSERTGRGVCASLAARLGHPGARASAGNLDATALWLFGAAGAKRFASSATSRRRSSGHLPDTGLVFLREGSTTVMFDTGRLGWGTLAAHGHADALQVTVSHDGATLVGDPGTGSYFGSPLVRNAFRGTGFHATVLVDDLDQAEIAGPFLWRNAPRVEALAVDSEQRTACGRHDGYSRLSAPVRHTRTVMVLEEGLVLVRDLLESSGRHRYSQRWPLPPGTSVEKVGDETLLVTGPGCSWSLRVFCSEAPTLSVDTGSMQPFAGWWSTRLEEIEPSPLVRVDVTSTGTIALATVLSVAEPVELERTADTSFVVRRGAVEREISIAVGA